MKQMHCLLIALMCVAAAPSQRPPTQPPARTAGKFDSFGVIPTAPPASAGWKRITEGGTGHVARWARINAEGKDETIMTLEMEPAKGRTAEKYATALAEQLKGKAVKDTTLMGGEAVFRVTGEREPNVPTEGLVAAHEKYIYVIAAFADTAAQLPRQAMNELAGTLKFIPLAEPSLNTELRGEKFPLFGKFVIAPLETMRPDPTPPPEGQISVSSYNFRAGAPDFIMNVQIIPNPNHASMQLLQQQFPGKLNPQATATWSKIGTTMPAALSTTFDAKAVEGGGKTRVGLVMLPPNSDIVMLFFTFGTTDPKAVAAYEKASAEVMKSIQPIRK